MHTRQEKLEAFGRILDILDELRVKCPWDRKQTNESLIKTLDEVMQIQKDGRQKRQEAEQEMRRMEKELKNKLLEIRR